MKRTTVTKGSGNIFRDLGFSEERSAELILTRSLLQALQETIRGQGWKQREAASRRVSTRPKCPSSSRERGPDSRSNDWFIFSRYSGRVEVTVKKAPRGQRFGTVPREHRADPKRWPEGSNAIAAAFGRFIPVKINLQEFLKAAEPPITANMLAKALEVPPNRITAIIKGQRGVTGDTAVRLQDHR